jgi:O-methyltransferase domain/Dimerisation domain
MATISEPTDGGSGVAPSLQLMQMIHGFVLSQVVNVAAKLGVADHLADGPKTSHALAQDIAADPDALYRLLRACAGFGLFSEVESQTFALTPLGDLLRSNATGSLRDYAIFGLAPGLWLPFGHLEQAIRSGKPQAKQVLGMELWEYFSQHEEESTPFAAAMSYLSAGAAREVVARYDVSQAKKIVDVGGSHGMLLTALLQAAPAAEGVLFDLPHVIEHARTVVGSLGLNDRVALRSGDFFQEVPPGGDLYLLKQILHDWDDAHCLVLLKNIHRAARSQSRLLVVEMLMPDQPGPSVVTLMDLSMLVLFGGRERSGKDFESLLVRAGYLVQRVIPTAGLFSVVEAVRVE